MWKASVNAIWLCAGVSSDEAARTWWLISETAASNAYPGRPAAFEGLLSCDIAGAVSREPVSAAPGRRRHGSALQGRAGVSELSSLGRYPPEVMRNGQGPRI